MVNKIHFYQCKDKTAGSLEKMIYGLQNAFLPVQREDSRKCKMGYG
jgi:hypothetical protein